jgi:hypothetical protein
VSRRAITPRDDDHSTDAVSALGSRLGVTNIVLRLEWHAVGVNDTWGSRKSSLVLLLLADKRLRCLPTFVSCQRAEPKMKSTTAAGRGPDPETRNEADFSPTTNQPSRAHGLSFALLRPPPQSPHNISKHASSPSIHFHPLPCLTSLTTNDSFPICSIPRRNQVTSP